MGDDLVNRRWLRRDGDRTTICAQSWRGEPLNIVVRGNRIEAIETVSPIDSWAADARVTALPGIWDHHVHLRAEAARARSTDVSDAGDREALGRVIRTAVDALADPEGDGLRVVGYDDTRVGRLDRTALDLASPAGVPVRMQHRSGHHWVLNSAAISVLSGAGLDVPDDGIVWGHARQFARAWPDRGTDGLGGVLRRLQGRGVIGVDDMTVDADENDLTALGGELGVATALDAFGAPAVPGSPWGVKIVLPDHRLVDPDTLARLIGAARPRRVAIHCVTVESLALLAAVAVVHLRAGDRIEHAFVTPRGLPKQLVAAMAGAPVSIGAHPGFIRSHGDRHLHHGGAADVADYQRLRTWHDAGAVLLGGTDTPFGPADPWTAMQAAVDRRTAAGGQFALEEALTPEEAFTMFTSEGLDARGPRLDLRTGGPADLCLIRGAWRDIRDNLGDAVIAGVIQAGSPRDAYRNDDEVSTE